MPQDRIDQRELLLRPQGSLEDDDIRSIPGAIGRVCRADRLDLDPEPAGGGDRALREQQIVLDDKETRRQQLENSRPVPALPVLAIAKQHLSLL